MSRRFPYVRWLQLQQFKLTPLEQIRYAVLVPYWRLQTWLRNVWRSEPVYRRIGGPLHDRKHAPWVAYSPDTKAPVVSEATRTGCRTRHGAAKVHWDCYMRDPRPTRARNVRLPDGTRGDVASRTARWRRKGSGDKLWIIGAIDISPDDVVFVDAATQDLRYEPPSADSPFGLERDLALHRPFAAALADDKFAAVAHGMLANLEWMRIGAHEMGQFNCLHDMTASLRNKGEDYFDFKFGGYPPVRLAPAEAAAHRRRMTALMRSLGWRTYTEDELGARVREDFRARVEHRVEGWRRLDAYEARSAGSHDVVAKTPPIMDMPMYEGEPMEWLEQLRGEERTATSRQFALRIAALAASGRITRGEYEDLLAW
jgi:hypothetical protein